jgi:hypothetical protein
MITEKTTFSQRDFLLKIYLVSLAVIGVYLAMSPLLQASSVKLALILTFGVVFLAGYIFTRKTTRFVASAHYHITCCYVLLLVNALVSGGIGAPGIIWFLLCPLIAFLTLSTRFARMWLVLIIITAIGCYQFDDYMILPTVQNPKLWYLTSYTLFFPTAYSILRIFRREVSRKNVELATMNEQLEDERKNLERTQRDTLLKSERLKEAEGKAMERSAKLSYYLNQLIEVKRMEELHSGGLEYSIQTVLQFLSKSMDLDSVAVWHIQADGQTLELLQSASTISSAYERSILCRNDFIEAYDMLATGAIMNSTEQTKEALQLKSLFQYAAGSNAMINCPYFIEGKFGGFISCRAENRKWSSEDVIFVRAISDILPLAFKSHSRQVQQLLLEEKQREISEVNESLERKVEERTNELNKRNKQLMDFAFTNAHHIRGPICRLLGLQNLLAVTTDKEEILKISQYMLSSVSELDLITKKTSEQLNMLVD